MPPAPNATMPSLDDRLPEHLDQDCSSDDFNEDRVTETEDVPDVESIKLHLQSLTPEINISQKQAATNGTKELWTGGKDCAHACTCRVFYSLQIMDHFDQSPRGITPPVFPFCGRVAPRTEGAGIQSACSGTTRTVEVTEETTARGGAEVFANRRAIVDSIGERYVLVRLSMPEGDQIDELEDLGMELGTVFQVVSIEKLNDGSWEMVASRVYVPTLAANLTRLYPGCHFDPKYDPFQPAPRDVDYFGIARARELTRQCVLKRAERMVEDSWPIAAACYAFLLQRPLPKPRL